MQAVQKNHKRKLSTLEAKIAPVATVYNKYRLKNGLQPILNGFQTVSEVLANLSTSCVHEDCGRDIAHKELGLCLLHFDEHLRAIKNVPSEDITIDPQTGRIVEKRDSTKDVGMTCLNPNCNDLVFRLAYCKRHYVEVLKKI